MLKKRLSFFFDRIKMKVIANLTTVYISTPDMARDVSQHKEVPVFEYIPNPVDLEHFTRRKEANVGTAFYLTQWYESADKARETAKQLGLHLSVLDRMEKETMAVKGRGMPYKDFPRFMQDFEYFIDRHNIPSLSKTALEALAMGLKVINWEGKILEKIN